MKRLVADTNVLVSAIQFGGKPKQLLDLAADGHIDLATSEAILEETFRVLRDKFHHMPEELGETAKQLRFLCSLHPPCRRASKPRAWTAVHHYSDDLLDPPRPCRV